MPEGQALTDQSMQDAFESRQREEKDMQIEQTIEKTVATDNSVEQNTSRHDQYEGLMFGISEADREIIRKVAIEARLKGVDYVDALKIAIATIRMVR
jgi:antirestriction protein ArdC